MASNNRKEKDMAWAAAAVASSSSSSLTSSTTTIFNRHKKLAAPSPTTQLGRRRGFGLLFLSFSSTFASSSAVEVSESNSRDALLQKYLKKSEDNKARNEKERRDGYYKRNYKDYFEFVEGSIRAKKDELSEAEKGILEWLDANK